MDVLEDFKKYLIEKYSSATGNNDNTINSYYSDIKQFIEFFKEEFGEDIVDFTKATVIEYSQRFFERKNYKYTTRNRKLASISIYEDFLIESKIRKDEKKYIRKKDFYKIERPLITASMLPRDTIKKVIVKAAEENIRDYTIMVLLDEMGLRVSELCKLEVKRDIDMEMFNIKVLGKGNKLRNLPMTNLVHKTLKEYLIWREEKLKENENRYLFISNKTINTGKPMFRTSINNIINKYCEKVNKNSINPHIFRHDVGTKLYEEGQSDLVIKKFLGHSSNATDVYTHPGNENLKDKKV